jgi:AraC family L-rhamnose operon regulatory protein RhaS
MEYFTQGRDYHCGFRMPIVYSRDCAIPKPDDGYYAVLAADRGYMTVDDGKERFLVKAPAILFLRPRHSVKKVILTEGTPHSLVFKPQAVNTTAPQTLASSHDDIERYFFFRPFRETGQSGFSVKSIPGELVPVIDDLCAKIDENLNIAQRDYWPCLSRSYFLELLILLERNWYISPEAETREERSGRTSFEWIKEFIHANYARAITLDALAARFATNRTTLNRRFNESCGMSAMAYLNTVRIEVAASLLRNTELGVAEISERVGFSDESYFSRAFKKKIGASPVAYRKSFPNPYS